jgi:hypothetical protein
MVRAALEASHDHPLSGHFGIQRTFDKLRTRFWWPNMHESVKQYILSCNKCKEYDVVRSKMHGHLKCFNPPNDAFQVVYIDFWGPVRESATGNRYVLVLTDNSSKYVIAKPMPTNSAKATAEFIINEFIMVHGAPKRIISDNGVHFNNTMMETITKTMHIKHAY